MRDLRAVSGKTWRQRKPASKVFLAFGVTLPSFSLLGSWNTVQ
jgi:hypothetical protein